MTTSRSDRPLLLVAACLLGGCTYTVRLLSEPDAAIVRLPSGREVVTPAEATFRWPFGRKTVRVEAEGYRPLVVDIQRTEGRVPRMIGASLFLRGERELTFVLVEDRPPVGGATPAPE